MSKFMLYLASFIMNPLYKPHIPHLFHRLSKNFSFRQHLQPPQKLKQKCLTLSTLLSQSKSTTIFTGAGISTSIGIPDYRSGQSTLSPTGPGIWNRTQINKSNYRQNISRIVDEAVPSLTHMIIKTLVRKGIVQNVISQNTDGLHLRSGVPRGRLVELHGNRNLEICGQCGKEYFRDFKVAKREGKGANQHNQNNLDDHPHFTGRYCQNCSGPLHDSIIYFGQKLSPQKLSKSFSLAASSSLLLCIGSTLTVNPAAKIPQISLKYNNKLVIINLQQTMYDLKSDVRIHYFCDDVMGQVMKNMGIQADKYVQKHHITIKISQNILQIQGKDEEGDNFTFIKGVKVNQKYKESVGHRVNVLLEDVGEIGEIQVQFYGTKDKAVLNINQFQYYKLHHGQQVDITIQRVDNSKWTLHSM